MIASLASDSVSLACRLVLSTRLLTSASLCLIACFAEVVGDNDVDDGDGDVEDDDGDGDGDVEDDDGVSGADLGRAIEVSGGFVVNHNCVF